ncbi:MAG TPA: bifunctional phosphopantothenoylcysteine decarboxylase/phosphopantothenate--cysteine ligase CoaBC [Thermoanaerobaculia bacterium]|nr:bifunctional phosphopantothenoylcysteine decarboxylase/phosphopantothenate--cysteine ligase CoaBC [Thermoanaerobaculia bacterium]
MKIVLGVSGGIAAYKAPELVRRLQDIGAEVRVVLTPNATRFVSPLSLAAVSHHGVIVEQWGDPEKGGVDHIELARWAELLLIAPATANILAKLAVGIADDALSTYAVAHRTAILVAPAMNWSMLQHPTVEQNLATLRTRGVEIIDSEAGYLAEGEEGPGRLAEIPVIVDRVRRHFGTRDLEGKRILITAGPTREPIDPVRYISNRSSGKMGYAIAEAARRRGASVSLVSGPTALQPPAGVEMTRVVTAQEMLDAVMARAASHQIVIKAAAVSDFAPVEAADRKIKKTPDRDTMELALRKNPDILAALAEVKPRPFIVAFAAETDAVEANAREKLQRKGADLIVANDVSDRAIGFDSEENEVLILSNDGSETRIARAPKLVIADRILDAVVQRLHG